MFSTLLFDLDDTLYPHDNGVWRAISGRISAYMQQRIGLSSAETRRLRSRYARSFGTTLTGLMADYEVDPADYLGFVHDIPLDSYIQPDEELRSMLSALPQTKAVFTNASRAHAERALELLGVADLIDHLIAIETLDLVNKPELAAYTRALGYLGRPEPDTCLLADDRAMNLTPASKLGMTTVLVDRDGYTGDGVDYAIARIHDLPRTVPKLWDGRRGD